MVLIRMKFNIVWKSEAAYLLDEEMSEIKDEIQEAQKYYTRKNVLKNMKMINEVL